MAEKHRIEFCVDTFLGLEGENDLIFIDLPKDKYTWDSTEITFDNTVVTLDNEV